MSHNKSKSKAEIAIKVDDLNKSFRLPTEKNGSIKQVFLNLFKGVKGYKEQKVLKKISFSVEKGDFFGVVGRNGSGKSTLLKLLAGIYQPTSGSITIDGSLVPFIELGVGFNAELTGRENVYMNGALLGFSNEDMDRMYDEIVKFAELHDFMDQKLKNYSSGMQVRLAFSIAIRAKSDILILDEVLAVGDEAFQRKCYQYFAKLRRDKKTVILVTHSMDAVQQFCNKAIMIQDGKITHSGNTAKVAQAYRELNSEDVMVALNAKSQTKKGDIKATVKYDNSGDKLIFDVSIESKIQIDNPTITFVIVRDTGEIVYRWVTDEKIADIIDIEENGKLRIKLMIDNIFPNAGFSVQLGVKKRDRTVEYAIFDDIVKFEIVNSGSYSGAVHWKPHEEFIYEQN